MKTLEKTTIARWWTGETYGYPVTILSSSGQPPRISGALLTVGERWLAKHQARPLMGGADRYGRPIRIWAIGPGYRVGAGVTVTPAWSHRGQYAYWVVRARQRVEIYPRHGRPSQEAAEAAIRANHPVAKRLLAAG